MSVATQGRKGYHHGDLRNALLEVAIGQAKAGGPAAIVLREAARQVGVSSTAAYRHFANHDELVEAVKQEGLKLLAARMRAELQSADSADPGAEAVRRIRAAGRGYVHFALAEPGLFRTVFQHTRGGVVDPVPGLRADEVAAIAEGRPIDDAYGLMSGALDELVVCGRLSAERRPYTDVVAWGLMHGLACLLLDTGLSQLPAKARDGVLARALEIFVDGL